MLGPFLTSHHIQKYHTADRMLALRRLTDLVVITAAFGLSERTPACFNYDRYTRGPYLMRIVSKVLT